MYIEFQTTTDKTIYVLVSEIAIFGTEILDSNEEECIQIVLKNGTKLTVKGDIMGLKIFLAKKRIEIFHLIK